MIEARVGEPLIHLDLDGLGFETLFSPARGQWASLRLTLDPKPEDSKPSEIHVTFNLMLSVRQRFLLPRAGRR